MKIRLAKKSDYENIMNLYNLFVEEDRYSLFDNDSFEKVLGNKSNYIFVAENERKLIGFATRSIKTLSDIPNRLRN